MRNIILVLLFACLCSTAVAQSKALVFQSDFGLKDGAVAAMKGVAYSVDSDLRLFDNTHEIPPFHIWDAAYRLYQTISYWPAGTVFVSVVDPGVGSERRSVVAKTSSGHFVVTPDNGTLTMISKTIGIDEVRLIDETKHRLRGSTDSYTFHGRDVYAYTGAKLAAGIISFDEVGAVVVKDFVVLNYQDARRLEGRIVGTIDVLDVQFGNVWSNIGKTMLEELSLQPGDKVMVRIFHGARKSFEGMIVFGNTFADVREGEPIIYINSLSNLAVGINQGDFAAKFRIGSGPEWSIEIGKGD